jgi:hypothetical protein
MSVSASDRRAAEFLDIGPIGACRTLRLPGSKSISNRSLLLAALARGTTELAGLLEADDVDRMRESLRALGVRIEEGAAGRSAIVHGVAGAFPVRRASLFLGNAGTAFRPLTAALALSHGDYELSGAPRMHERPIGDLVDALRALGADIRYAGAAGFPPLTIAPGAVRGGGKVAIRGNVSSQFVTALLMARLPLAGGDATVEVQGELISRPAVDMTLALMRRFGVAVVRERDDLFGCLAAGLCESGNAVGGRRCLVGIVFSAAGRSAADRCASRASARAASRATSALPRRCRQWAPTSAAATIGSRCAARQSFTASTPISTRFPTRR